jgi:hypothetical protein
MGLYSDSGDDSCDARRANVTHLALASVTGRAHAFSTPPGLYGVATAPRGAPIPAQSQLDRSLYVLASCSALEASPSLVDVLATRHLERDVLQALVNVALSRSPDDTQALRLAAERAALDVGRLEWDGACQVASGLCHAAPAEDATAAEL